MNFAYVFAQSLVRI